MQKRVKMYTEDDIVQMCFAPADMGVACLRVCFVLYTGMPEHYREECAHR